MSSSNKWTSHTREMAGKAQKALNATWGLIERTGRNTIRDRLYLCSSLVRSGALYGVEIWGWGGSREIEAMHRRYCKAAMGVAKNTPEYIWRTEGGMESIMVTVRKRACMYLLDIMRMEDKRWPKVCLREECRGILNGEPTRWGNAVVMALEEMKCSDVIRMIWEKKEIAVIEDRLNEGLNYMEAALTCQKTTQES